MHWMLMPFRRYFDFSGRSRRMEYWMFTVFYVIVHVALFVVVFADFPWREIFANSGGGDTNTISPDWEPGALFWTGVVGIGLFYVVTVIPSIAVTVRRFHDQNLSGWLALLYWIPYVGVFIIWVFMFIEGTRGPNRYGEDPKDMNSTRAFE